MLKKIKRILTPVLLVLGIFAFLAGTDIYHGTEPNLSTEWSIFSSFFYLAYLYIVIDLFD
jgi:hypothetical protein